MFCNRDVRGPEWRLELAALPVPQILKTSHCGRSWSQDAGPRPHALCWGLYSKDNEPQQSGRVRRTSCSTPMWMVLVVLPGHDLKVTKLGASRGPLTFQTPC